ncbi:MAG TPA: hypothetical protein VKN16_26210 [Methylomirabilota bacterium]|nr:hypothetical protein [Methylomirabilota bacterium]
MIFRECFAIRYQRLITAISGHVVADEDGMDAHPILLVRALVPRSDAVVAETTTTKFGEFRLEVGLPVPVSLHVLVQDAGGARLGESVVEVREPVQALRVRVPRAVLQRAVPVRREHAPPALLVRASAAALRGHVSALIREGTLDVEATDALEQAIRPLAWADGLMADARGVLAGDMEAGDRLRAALLSLGAGPSLGQDDDAGSERAADDVESERPDAQRILDRVGLAQIAAAVVWAVEDPAEIRAALNGLAAVLWSSPWIDLLLRASTTGATGAMKPLMGGPGPGWGLPPAMPGLPSGPPGLPLGPGLPPGWGKVPRPKGKIPGKLGDLVPDFKPPLNQMPSEEEKCLIGALAQVAERKRTLPQYEIRTIDDPSACPGEVVVLGGVNFGVTGSVVFPGKGDGVVATDVLAWSDTAIRVRVPAGAGPGVIRLSIYEGSLCLCGRIWSIYRLGRTLPFFAGGVPAILDFKIDGVSSAISVEPGAGVSVTFASSVGPGVTTQVVVRNGGAVVFDTGALPGGVHAVTFTAPSVSAPTTLQAEASATNDCGTSRETLSVLVVKQPALRVLGVEVTQAIQRLDNSLRLGARRRTLVRVYLDAGLGLFGFAGSSSTLPGVTGTISLWRDNQHLATVPALNSPYTTIATFFPTARYALGGSLNFLLPTEHLFGDLRLDVNVRVETFPAGVEDGPNCTAVRTVHVKFEPLKKVSLVRIMLADDWRNLPAPTVAEWQTALQGAIARFPVADDGWEIRVHPGYTVVTVDRDLGTGDGWDDLLEDLDDVAGDADDSWDHRWVGLLPAFRPGIDSFTTKGSARSETTDRPWPLSNDYLVMACVAGRPEVFAHELGHTFGMHHANCPAGGPDDIDPGLPAYIEETGVDVYAMTPVVDTITGELMGYCAGNGLWPSTVTWQRSVQGLA